MTVEISNLVKQFGPRIAVQIPSWHIESGEVIGLVGSNGAGKTTLLRMLLDLILPDEGEVRINGEKVQGSNHWKRQTGSFLDESFLIDYLTADEFFAFVGRAYGLRPEEIASSLDRFRPFYPDEVIGHTTKYLRELSKGNGKKIGIIAALLIDPALLILDEPFANLDPPSQLRLIQMLQELNTRCGTTMIISSHDLMHVTGLCRRITLLENGHIVRDTPTNARTLRELEAYFAV